VEQLAGRTSQPQLGPDGMTLGQHNSPAEILRQQVVELAKSEPKVAAKILTSWLEE
jgi:hypothetical protein